MQSEYFATEQDGGIFRITFNRPDRANAINLGFARDFKAVAEHCAADASIRCVLISAEGALFSAGGDLGSFKDAGDGLPDALGELLGNFHPAIETFSKMNAPVIAAINGTAAGAGLALVASCSFTYATAASKFTMAYTGVALTPDGSSTWFLPRCIGMRRAEELAITNEVLSAEKAADWGLLNGVVADEAALTEKVEKLAAKLAKGPTQSYGVARRLMLSSLSNDLPTQLDLEGEGIVGVARSHDGREGISAFLEKRKPEFKGE